MKWQALVVLIYALFIVLGGLIGYVKAHSHPSLIIGVSTGILLIISSLGIYNGALWGLILSFILTSLLIFFFGYRFYISQSFFPAGIMTIFSTITLLFLSFLPKK